ncbi:hypothetical protein NUA48_004632 [Salmonella enterica]|nr:hypothetical protein [Salmonella enterica]
MKEFLFSLLNQRHKREISMVKNIKKDAVWHPFFVYGKPPARLGVPESFQL